MFVMFHKVLILMNLSYIMSILTLDFVFIWSHLEFPEYILIMINTIINNLASISTFWLAKYFWPRESLCTSQIQ